MSEKIRERHLGRRAIVYVRQSTPGQVQSNTESRRLQYAMRERMQGLGWSQIEVIDEDLGRSASGMAERAGFQRLVAEVSLGEIGAVAARELSRFARNSREWQKLIEVCRYVDTLLVDQDSIYDARAGNDRLLLGLKGTLNEYELDLLRLRALEARSEKARRGEYVAKVAVGYRKSDDGQIEKTPDLRVQHIIRLAFDKTLELGSARQCLFWLREQGIQLPVNRNHRGEVVWKDPNYGWLHHVLTNPLYAGDYVYGRTVTKTVFQDGVPRARLHRRPQDQWTVLLRDHHEAYVDRERFDRIQQMLSNNSMQRRATAPGAPKRGVALLSGLLRCRRCGEKLLTTYSGDGSIVRYACSRRNASVGAPHCINFAGAEADARIAQAILDVVRQSAIEASFRAAVTEADARDEVLRTLRLERESAQYVADRAFRQFDAADPENRLVVDELERRWNEALEKVRSIDERLHAAMQVVSVQPPDPIEFLSLGADLARVWADADMRLKKRIVRTLIEEVVVDVDSTTSEIVSLIHWKGGVHTELRVPKRRRGYNSTQTSADVADAIRTLALICRDEHIARWLNLAEVPTGRGNRWSRSLVASFRSARNIPAFSAQLCQAEGWLTLEKAADLVGIAEITLKRAVARGVLSAKRPLPRGPWLIRKDELLRPEVRDRLLKKRRAGRNVPAGQSSRQLTLENSRT